MKKVMKRVITIFLSIILLSQNFSEVAVSYAGSMENVIEEKTDTAISGENWYGRSRVVDITDEILEKVDDETNIDLSVDGSSSVILQNIQMDCEGEGVDMPEGVGKNSSFLKKVSTGSEPNSKNISNDFESNGDNLLESNVELLESSISVDNGYLESHNTNPGVYLSESETEKATEDLNSQGETEAKTGYKKLATSATNKYNYKTNVVYSERTLNSYQLLNNKKKIDVSFEEEEKRRENTEKEGIIEEKVIGEETTEINHPEKKETEEESQKESKTEEKSTETDTTETSQPEKKETEEESQEESKTEEKSTETDTTETSQPEKKETEEESQEESKTEEKSTETDTTEIRLTEEEKTEEESQEESKTEEKNTETDTSETSQIEERESEEETTEEIIKQEADIISGDTGEVTFTFDSDTATLKISGNGNMADYSSANNTPWYSYRTSIKNIVISPGVKYIGKYSFANMTEITNIEIPNTLLSIGHYAFYCDTAILNIDLPDDVEKIGYKAFYGCSSLESVNIPLNWNECSSTNGSTMSTDYCGSIFGNCQKLTKVSVPNGMKEIPSYAFSNCNYLVSVELPESMEVIKNQAFYGCLKLQDITIPNGVTDIQKSAFYNCRELTSINFPEGIKSIGAYAFYNCSKLTEANLCDTIEKIGYQAFYGCATLTSVTIPLNWNECPSSNTNGTMNTSYCGCIFQGCNKLAEVSIPEGMTEIPAYAFNFQALGLNPPPLGGQALAVLQ